MLKFRVPTPTYVKVKCPANETPGRQSRLDLCQNKLSFISRQCSCCWKDHSVLSSPKRGLKVSRPTSSLWGRPKQNHIFAEGPIHSSHRSKDTTCLQLLLRAKGDVDLQFQDGSTALSIAAAERIDTAFVDVLLTNNANLESERRGGQRPLHGAAIRGRDLILSSLLEGGANINATSSPQYTTLHWAIIFRNHIILGILLDNRNLQYQDKDIYRSTVLHHAAFHADLETLNILTSRSFRKLDVTEKNWLGNDYTAIEYARWRKNWNQQWASACEHPPDFDPLEWYIAFGELLESITSALHRSASQSTNDGWADLPGMDIVEEDRVQKCYQDAAGELEPIP